MTVVVNSRGSELSIENGTRTDLPATPKVGRSRLKSSTSGSRVRLPTGTAKIGTPRIRSAGRRQHRRLALVPVAVRGQHHAAQVLDLLRCPGKRVVQIGAVARAWAPRTAGSPRSSARAASARSNPASAARSPRAAWSGGLRRPRDRPEPRRACPCSPKRPTAPRSPASPRDGTPRSIPAG